MVFGVQQGTTERGNTIVICVGDMLASVLSAGSQRSVVHDPYEAIRI
jgi:hypothetical protein